MMFILVTSIYVNRSDLTDIILKKYSINDSSNFQLDVNLTNN